MIVWEFFIDIVILNRVKKVYYISKKLNTCLKLKKYFKSHLCISLLLFLPILLLCFTFKIQCKLFLVETPFYTLNKYLFFYLTLSQKQKTPFFNIFKMLFKTFTKLKCIKEILVLKQYFCINCSQNTYLFLFCQC